MPFETGLADTVRWYRDNRAWWEPLKSGASWGRDDALARHRRRRDARAGPGHRPGSGDKVTAVTRAELDITDAASVRRAPSPATTWS